MANIEINMISLLTSSKEDLIPMALRLFEENLKLKYQAVLQAKQKDQEIHDLQIMVEKKTSQIDMLRLSKFNSNSSKFFYSIYFTYWALYYYNSSSQLVSLYKPIIIIYFYI